MGHAIFISYRRDDTEGEAGRLFDDLVRTFGDGCVFMDVAGITPGADFRNVIEENVVSCGVLLAMIGPSWVTIKGAGGNARLSDPNDFVRIEIGSALKRNVAVIPVLVHDAKMPHPEDLPDDLRDLCYRNSVELSHARWNSDVALLTTALKSYVTTKAATEQQPVHATVSVQLPAPRPADGDEESAPKSSFSPLMQGAAIAVLLVVGILGYLLMHHRSSAHSKAVDAAAAVDTAQAGAQASRLKGRWMLPAAQRRVGNNLAFLAFDDTGQGLTMRALGSCQPKSCDWGTQPADWNGKVATAVFQLPADGGATRTATVKAGPGMNGLDVEVHNAFVGGAGTKNTESRLEFVPYRNEAGKAE